MPQTHTWTVGVNVKGSRSGNGLHSWLHYAIVLKSYTSGGTGDSRISHDDQSHTWQTGNVTVKREQLPTSIKWKYLKNKKNIAVPSLLCSISPQDKYGSREPSNLHHHYMAGIDLT